MFVLISFAGAVQGLFLAVLLCTMRKSSRQANPYLAVFIVAYSLLNVQDAIDASGMNVRVPVLANLFEPFVLLLAPAIYFYVRALVFRPEKRAWALIPHAVPAILLFAALQLAFWSIPPEQRVEIIRAESGQTKPGDPVILFIVFQMVLYWAAMLLALRGYLRTLKQSLSTLEPVSYRWLRILLPTIGALFVSWIVGLFSGSEFWLRLSTVGFSIGVYTLGYFGLRQPEVFLDLLPDAEQSGPAPSAAPEATETATPQDSESIVGSATKYAKSGLTPDLAAAYLKRLEALVQEEKPHLESSLTLSELAKRLRILPHHLSQVINQQRGETFFDFINCLRVQEAQRALSDPTLDDKNILEIAFDCGFSSKAGFNAAFKKHTNMTPTQYRRLRPIPPAMSCSPGEEVLSDRR